MPMQANAMQATNAEPRSCERVAILAQLLFLTRTEHLHYNPQQPRCAGACSLTPAVVELRSPCCCTAAGG
jgi:hypothetical protein